MSIAEVLSGSVTKSAGTIYGGGFCQSCGKPLPESTRRRRFCNDTCRQAAYRSKTGKSARRGTLRLKAEIPSTARKGMPATAMPQEWALHTFRTVVAAIQQPGIIECYHHEYGRGIIDLHRMIAQIQSPYTPEQLKDAHTRFKGWDVICSIPEGTWRCLFNRPKKWLNLPAPEVYLLKFHPIVPSHLQWLHKDDRVRIRLRRNRTIRIDFNKIGVMENGDGTYALYRELPDNHAANILSELTEDTGKHHDCQQFKIVTVDDLDKTDTDGGEGNNEL